MTVMGSVVRSTEDEYLSKSKVNGNFFYLSKSKSTLEKSYLSKSKKYQSFRSTFKVKSKSTD